MRTRIVVLTVVVLSLGALGILLLRTDTVYTSRQELVNETISDVLRQMDGKLPQERADLAMLGASGSSPVPLSTVSEWRVAAPQVENAFELMGGLPDDDPIYRISGELHVAYEDGQEARLLWESWRYGLVLGPVVSNLGDGPPGAITAVSAD